MSISSRVFKVITELLRVKRTRVTYALFPERRPIKIIPSLGRFIKRKTRLRQGHLVLHIYFICVNVFPL